MDGRITTHKTSYRPGEEIRGRVEWQDGQRTPAEAEIVLFWRTRGKGTEDGATVKSLKFDQPQGADGRDFSFPAPDFPLSFSGRLISVSWALRLFVEKGEVATQEIVIAPNGIELSLNRPEWLVVPPPPKPKWPWAR